MPGRVGIAAKVAAFCTLAIVCGAWIALPACSSGEARAPNPTRPLTERRAIEVIRKAMRDDRLEPAPGRNVQLSPSGKTMHIDVGVRDHEFGVAYITQEDAHVLGDAIPPPNRKDERLRIVRAGSDGETRIVVLYQDNYLYDDLAGEAHEQTSIAVESQLTRDVQDFITHARTQKYK
jgi:hypothetical protein